MSERAAEAMSESAAEVHLGIGARSASESAAGYLGEAIDAVAEIPEARFEVMAAKLAERLPNRLDLDQARLAWRSDFDSFMPAIAPRAHGAFEKLIEEIKPSRSPSIFGLRGFAPSTTRPSPTRGSRRRRQNPFSSST